MDKLCNFYAFTTIDRPALVASELRGEAQRANVLGTVLLAKEGINAAVWGRAEQVEPLVAGWVERFKVAGADIKWANVSSGRPPFERLKVKVRPEIVTMGAPGVYEDDPDKVDADAWDQLVARDDVKVIDTRNDYEFALGTFDGAIDPLTGNFREFPDWAAAHLDAETDREVAIFCTGGIRCEKAARVLKAQGIHRVYQLQGGILQYLEQRRGQAKTWRGDCFVFDDRVAVDGELQTTQQTICGNCRMPVSVVAQADPGFEAGISCPSCIDDLTVERRRSLEERRRQQALAHARAHVS